MAVKWLLFVTIGVLLIDLGSLTSIDKEEQGIVESNNVNRLVRSPENKGVIEQKKQKERKTKRQKNKKQRNGKETKNEKETKKTKLNQKLNAKRRTKGKKGKKGRRNQPWKRKGKKPIARQTCSATTPVASTCMENAKSVLVYEETQVTNYLKQSKQLIRHGAQADSKRGKKGEFVHAAEHMMMAIGGNISAPLCGNNASDSTTRRRQQRALDLHLENYEKLMNCSAAIQEACTVPEKAYNETALVKIKACNTSMEEYRTFTKTCQTTEMKEDATKQCACWAEAKTKMNAIKAQKCSINNEKKQVTAEKRKCVKVFGKCKKMEDQSVELIDVCMAEHSMKLINQTAESLHLAAMTDTGKELAAADETAKDVLSGNADMSKQFDNDPYNDHD